jgi:hypothetical protein
LPNLDPLHANTAVVLNALPAHDLATAPRLAAARHRHTTQPSAWSDLTTDATAARAWRSGHLDTGIEGVVAKRLNQPYRPGSAWRKVRAGPARR